MAGSYPDPPSYKIAYDADSTGVYYGLPPAGLFSNAACRGMNGEAGGGGFGSDQWVVMYFQRKVDIVGYYFRADNNAYGGGSMTLETSVDSTNGQDGTWVGRSVGWTSGTDPQTYGRNNITSVSWLGVRCMRFIKSSQFGYGAGFNTFHLYGAVTAGEDLNKVQLWHPTLDQRLGYAALDWGNVPRGSTSDLTFRVKNLSSTYTAVNTLLSFDQLTAASPSQIAQQYLSSDGTNFFGTLTISSLAPGATSPVYTMRRVTPTNAQLGAWQFRLQAVPASWT